MQSRETSLYKERLEDLLVMMPVKGGHLYPCPARGNNQTKLDEKSGVFLTGRVGVKI